MSGKLSQELMEEIGSNEVGKTKSKMLVFMWVVNVINWIRKQSDTISQSMATSGEGETVVQSMYWKVKITTNNHWYERML